MLRQDRCLLLRQDGCLLLRQDRCLLLRQDRCLLLHEQTSVLSQHTLLRSQKSPLCQCSNLRSLNCGNVTMFNSQRGGLALNRRKWAEMGPESSPGPENRPPGMPRPFSRLWDRSRGPKPRKYSPNSRSTAPGGRYVMEQRKAAPFVEQRKAAPFVMQRKAMRSSVSC